MNFVDEQFYSKMEQDKLIEHFKIVDKFDECKYKRVQRMVLLNTLNSRMFVLEEIQQYFPEFCDKISIFLKTIENFTSSILEDNGYFIIKIENFTIPILKSIYENNGQQQLTNIFVKQRRTQIDGLLLISKEKWLNKRCRDGIDFLLNGSATYNDFY